MLSDEDDSLGLFTAGSTPLQAYNYKTLASNVGSVNTTSAVASALSSDSTDESFSLKKYLFWQLKAQQ